MLNIYERKNTYTPRSVTQEKIEEILEKIRNGGPVNKSAKSCGISHIHFNQMVKMGEYDLLQENMDTMCAKMVIELNCIQLDQIQRCIKSLLSNRSGHKGCQWILENVHHDEYGTSSQLRELKIQVDELRDIMNGENKNVERSPDPRCDKDV